MGTNYYFNIEAPPPCECCGRHYEEDSIHIGKSSAGWHFALHVIPEKGLNSFCDWFEFLHNTKGNIVDEYGNIVSIEQLVLTILNRKWDDSNIIKGADWYKANSAVPGLRGLVRAAVDGWHCIGHGDGTYDYIKGDFY